MSVVTHSSVRASIAKYNSLPYERQRKEADTWAEHFVVLLENLMEREKKLNMMLDYDDGPLMVGRRGLMLDCSDTFH